MRAREQVWRERKSGETHADVAVGLDVVLVDAPLDRALLAVLLGPAAALELPERVALLLVGRDGLRAARERSALGDLELDGEVLGVERRLVLLGLLGLLVGRIADDDGRVVDGRVALRVGAALLARLAELDEEARQLGVALHGVLVCRALEDDALAQEEELVGLRAEGDGVRAEQARLVLEEALGPDDAVEQVGGDVRVDSAERVVEEVDVGAGVDGASESDPSLLAARQGDTLLADLGLQAVEGKRGEGRGRGQRAPLPTWTGREAREVDAQRLPAAGA